MKSDPPGRERFAAALLDWFAKAMRPLPWRRDYVPYHVWLSEIMLQQTQMGRGVEYFNAWLRRFPDIRSVAEAPEEVVLAAWEGLGYYSRARNLHAAAKRIMEKHGGVFPDRIDDIRALPGVGGYTAGAIAAIAFNQPEPAVDANVLRIFARLYDIDKPVKSGEMKAFVAEAARALIPAGSSRLFCQALMELGALVCGKTPRCAACPIAGFCAARRHGTAAARPVKNGKAEYKSVEMAAGVIRRDGHVLIQKRPPGGLWPGLWEFPCGPVSPGETPEKAVARIAMEQVALPVFVREKIAVVRHGYTTNRATMHGYFCDAADDAVPELRTAVEFAWIRPEEAERFAFSAGNRKLLECLGWKKGRA